MKNILFLIPLLFLPIVIFGQTLDTIRGLVRDSSGSPIPNTNVWVYFDKDSIHVISNEHGYVIIPIKFTNNITVKVTSIGYEENKIYLGKDLFFTVVLKEKINYLKEVIIKSTINPVIIKGDTVEYDVNHFIKNHDEVIQDLLARLPGLQVNPDGSISVMGENISKIKINGQEFIINDITTLTSIIPANLIDKIQLIDDYGEQSRITGRKTGKSQKIINLTTSQQITNFYAGRSMLAKGTGNLYSIYSNLFNYSDKQSISLLLTNDNIGKNIGKTKNIGSGLSFNKTFSKKFALNSNASYNKNSADQESKSVMEIITDQGVLSNNININGNNTLTNFISTIEMSYLPTEKNNFKINANTTSQHTTSTSLTNNIQNGFQRKNQLIKGSNENNIDEYESEILFSHKFSKTKRLFLIQINLKSREEKISNDLENNLRFYNNNNNGYSDSLLHQLIIGHILTFNHKISLSYVEPVSDFNNIEFNYTYFDTNQETKRTTNWMDENGKFYPVDTLGNNYTFKSIQNQIEINLQHKKDRFEFLIGGSIRSYNLLNSSGIPIFPVFQINYGKKNKEYIKFKYSGENIFPTFQQLSQIPDYSDIQNPVLGNPNLKASQKHNINFDYFKIVKASTIIVKISGNTIHNNIVNNISLVEDVLGTMKQETHFLNSNGNFTLENINSWLRQLNNGNFEIQLGTGLNQNTIYYNNIKKQIQNWKLTGKLGGNYKSGIFNLSLNTFYTFSKSNFSIYSKSIISQNINAYSYNLITLNKNLNCEFVASKQFNFGFGSALNYNPLMLDIRVNKWWFNKKIASVLECNNLLNENAQISQSITNNMISASTSNNRGRYFILKFIFDIKAR